MSKCGKSCMPECEYFTTGGCVSPFNCLYKIEEISPKSAASIGDAFVQGLIAENAALRERLENAVEFPFRTGQELYMIDDFKHANVWKGICNGIEVKQTRIPQQLIFYVYASFEDPETCTLRARKFTNETLNEIYTTRKVAEARLAELKGETK